MKTEKDYGLDMLDFALRSGDYGWTPIDKKPRKHLLLNVDDAHPFLKLYTLASFLRGTRHSEWESLMSALFIRSVMDYDEGRAEAVNMYRIFFCH